MSRLVTRSQFKLPNEPWADLNLKTADAKRVATLVNAAVTSQAFVSILGVRGSGKSVAVGRALATHDVRVVAPLRLARDKLHMGDIETALIRELSDETPRRSGEARSHQVKRLLGEASRQTPVVLVLDDAHWLHAQTLRALKRLRELSWLGQSPLLGILLLGQRDNTARIDEVRLRADHLWLEGLTPAEARRAIGAALGKAIESQAAARLSKSPYARNWLDLQALADACLADALSHAERSVTVGAVNRVVGAIDDEAPDTPPNDAAVAEFLKRDQSTVSHALRKRQAAQVPP